MPLDGTTQNNKTSDKKLSQSPTMTDAAAADDGVIIGPDLNPFKSPLDKKVYRQILLPNGLQVVLISDTVAMSQDFCVDDSDDDDEDEDMAEDDDDDDDDKEEDDDNDEDEEGENDDDDDDATKPKSGESDDGLRDAAAAMVVGVGSLFDPPEAQGMAHFLEHMLFMGTDKYPTENAYDAFLSKHGGGDNAYTESEYTVYHLSIPQEKLFAALDMFCQFFIAPLLLEEAVDRELNSIESEFQLSKNSDQCRMQQLMCHTSGGMKDGHPFTKFGWGNLKSLKDIPAEAGVDIMNLLRTFYDQYYFAKNMRLVVVGGYSLDELQAQVVKRFSDIPEDPRAISVDFPMKFQADGWDTELESPMRQLSLPFQPSSLGKIYRVVPVKDRHALSVTWQLPSQTSNWRSKPGDYISHLLGHESEGSLLASLKEKSWVSECFCGVGSEGLEFSSSHALFCASFTLSEEGMDHWAEIVEEMYTYLGMLRYYSHNDALPAWIYEELRLTHEVAYKFGDEQTPEDLVETIADRLAPHFRLPPERRLDGDDLIFEFNGGLIRDLLDNYLVPANGRVDLMSSTFGRASDYAEDGDIETGDEVMENEKFVVETAGPPKMEPMFGGRYWCRTLQNSTVEQWNQAFEPKMPPAISMLALPPKNPFIPEQLDLKPLPPDDTSHPLLYASLMICIVVGKRKAWFPGSVTKYNSIKDQILVSYEDEEEKWHRIDLPARELTPSVLLPGFESTLDNKKIKFRLVALAKDGEGAILKYGDDTDFEVDEGASFPAIPPASPVSRLPQLVCNTPTLKLWHLQDRKFKRPIAELRVRLICEGANKTPLHKACADLFVKLCADAVTEISYLASVSELGSSQSSNDVGFSLRVHGFDDKLLKLFESIFKVVLSFRGEQSVLPSTIRDGRFEACLEVLGRNYANSGQKASKLSSDVRLRCLRATTWSSYAKLKALEGLTVELFAKTMNDIMSNIALEALYHGNVDKADAEDARRLIVKMAEESGRCGLSQKMYPLQAVTMLPQSINATFVRVPAKDPSEPNSAVEIYIQIGKDRIEDRVMIDLITHLMDEPLFDQVRTKDQFGYSVSCDARWTYGVVGIYFHVVSSTKSASEITDRIEQFLSDYRKELVEMKSETFMEHLVGLAKKKLDMFHSLSDECGSFWGEITDGRFEWQAWRHETIILRSITKEQTIKAYDDWLTPGNVLRRRLIVQVLGGEGRPKVNDSEVMQIMEDSVSAFHGKMTSTWGKISY